MSPILNYGIKRYEFRLSFLQVIFYIKFLHLSLDRCDIKLKPVLIDCFVYASLGSGFMHFPEHLIGRLVLEY